jgi:trans-2,3-dihydro-3-hydroxyanthranilate isomerase
MFAPFYGVPEDPATGSASCALAGLLAHHDAAREGDFHWRIAQGVEMGRPSKLDAKASKRGGEVVATGVGGRSVMVSHGLIEAGGRD